MGSLKASPVARVWQEARGRVWGRSIKPTVTQWHWHWVLLPWEVVLSIIETVIVVIIVLCEKNCDRKKLCRKYRVKWKQDSILYWGFYSPSKLSCSSGEAATSLSCHYLKAFRWKSIYFLSQRLTRIICTVWFSTHWATEQSHAIICILFVLAFFYFFCEYFWRQYIVQFLMN